MGRPAKAIAAQSGNVNAGIAQARKETEDMLRGEAERIEPAFALSENQMRIFGMIKEMFGRAELLGEADCFVLTEAAVVIDRLQQIEMMINNDPEKLTDRDVCNTRKEYMQNFFRICNELSLSPQSRAKMGIIAAGKDKRENDPVLRIFAGNEESG